MQFPVSELVLDNEGRVYHLGIHPEQVADTILLVGDQDRVSMISDFFEVIEHKSRHREFVCHTGWYKNKRLSAISTGIGTDNIDIVVHELDALVNIDLNTRTEKPVKKSLELIRIGTSGILQNTIPLHSFLLSSHAIGLDNLAHYYLIEMDESEKNITAEFRKHLKLKEVIHPYCIAASEDLLQKLKSDSTIEGITVTSPGFYGPQGRVLRLKPSIDNLNEKLESFNYKGMSIINLEMESSALFALSKALGHKAVTICVGIANRPNMEFSKNYHAPMNNLISHVLNSLD